MNPASAMITFSCLQRIKEMVRKPVFPFPLPFLKPPATQVKKVPKTRQESGRYRGLPRAGHAAQVAWHSPACCRGW